MPRTPRESAPRSRARLSRGVVNASRSFRQRAVRVTRVVGYFSLEKRRQPIGNRDFLIGVSQFQLGEPERRPIQELVDLPNKAAVVHEIAAFVHATADGERPDGLEELLRRLLLDLDALNARAHLDCSVVTYVVRSTDSANA